MSFRLCVIGNSHAAAFVTGWPQIADRFPDVTVTYFAARAQRLAELTVAGDALRARSPGVRKELAWTSGGRAEIVPRDYDAVWIVGLGIGVEPAIGAYRSFWAESHHRDCSRTPISDAAFAATIDGALGNSLACRIAGLVRGIADLPVSLIAQPNPSADLVDGRDERTAPFRLAIRQGDDAVLWQQYRAGIERLRQRGDFAILEQPDDMRVGALLTDARWSRGSVRLTPGLSKEHERDYVHMNADYGAAMYARHLPGTIAACGDAAQG